jgi:hypothetical protein
MMLLSGHTLSFFFPKQAAFIEAQSESPPGRVEVAPADTVENQPAASAEISPQPAAAPEPIPAWLCAYRSL